MRLGQVKWNGAITAAIFDHVSARPIPDYTLCDLILRAEKEGEELAALASGLASRHPVSAVPLIPLTPREVWAAGSTYMHASATRDAALGANYYSDANKAARPEIVFKGTGRVCVGPNQTIGIRPDSSYTVPAPEIAVVLGTKGHIVGYTLGNDVTALDLEAASPVYTAQAKTYSASCALGPYLITADELPNPESIELSICIEREGKEIYSAQVSAAEAANRFQTLVEYLMRANPVPAGSVLLTGSGIIVSPEAALAEGDFVTISAGKLGELRNRAAVVN